MQRGIVIIEKEQKKLERSLTKKFFKKKEFTKFEKDTLNLLKAFIFSTKSMVGNVFYQDLEDNEEALNGIIDKLDKQSADNVKTFVKTIKYISTHLYVDLIQDLFNKEEELMRHIDKINSYRDLKLPENLYEESVFGYHHGLKYLPEKRIKSLNNMDFLDCGAYVGDSALIFEKFYHPKKIYSFEPDKESYELIFNTIKLNNLKKVVPVKLGVGSKNNIVEFLNMASGSHITNKEGKYQIQITSLDNYVFERSLDVGLIKLDVEGYAYQALKGAIRTIEAFKPVLLVCIYHCAEELINGTKFVQDLNMDYKIMIRHLGGLIPATETHLIAW